MARDTEIPGGLSPRPGGSHGRDGKITISFAVTNRRMIDGPMVRTGVLIETRGAGIMSQLHAAKLSSVLVI